MWVFNEVTLPPSGQQELAALLYSPKHFPPVRFSHSSPLLCPSPRKAHVDPAVGAQKPPCLSLLELPRGLQLHPWQSKGRGNRRAGAPQAPPAPQAARRCSADGKGLVLWSRVPRSTGGTSGEVGWAHPGAMPLVVGGKAAAGPQAGAGPRAGGRRLS